MDHWVGSFPESPKVLLPSLLSPVDLSQKCECKHHAYDDNNLPIREIGHYADR